MGGPQISGQDAKPAGEQHGAESLDHHRRFAGSRQKQPLRWGCRSAHVGRLAEQPVPGVKI